MPYVPVSALSHYVGKPLGRSEWLKIDHTDEDKRAIRLHTFRGSPWCTPEFLVYLERLTGRTLGPQKPGRPQKENRDKTGRLPFS